MRKRRGAQPRLLRAACFREVAGQLRCCGAAARLRAPSRPSSAMRILAVVHAVIAAALLLMGLVTTFSIGITGLVFLLAAALFAATAGVAATGSRAAVLLTLMLDGALAAYAVHKLAAPGVTDVLVPAVTLTLVAIVFVAVLLDWRRLMARKWFEGDAPLEG